MASLDEVRRLDVSPDIMRTTWASLRQYGERELEGFVLWLGRIEGRTATIELAFTPPQSSISGEDGVGYFVTSETLFRLNQELHRTRLRLIAQVHSHPREAYHSRTDDLYAVVTAEGGLSVVVPDFAFGEPDLATCAVYRLSRGQWMPLSGPQLHGLARSAEWSKL